MNAPQVLEITGRGGHFREFEHGPNLMTMLGAAIGEFGKRSDAMALYRRRVDGERYPEIARKLGKRMDTLGGNGLHLARDLEFIHTRVLEEKHPTPNGLTKFRTGSSVPIGTRTHTVRRMFQDGEAMVYRGGTDVPRVGISQDEEEFQVRHYVTSSRTNHFELLSSNFANTSEEERKTRAARKVMELFLNRMIWGIGPNEAHGIHGIINYPWLAKKVSQVLFDGTADVDVVLGVLQDAEEFPEEESDDVFAPNRCLTTPRVRNYLMNTRLGSVNDTTIGGFFIENSENINAIEKVWELKNIGGEGVDGILFYNDSEDGIMNEMVQSMTPLPQQSFGFDNITYWYMSHGGIIMRDVGGNILLLVTVVP